MSGPGEFRYRAVDPGGAVVTGRLSGTSAAAVLERLRAQGHLPIEVAPARAGGLAALLATEITPRGALSARERIGFMRALATLIGAGLPLDRALTLTRDLGSRGAVRGVAGRVLTAVQGGASLADAMEREPAAFAPVTRALVRAGEAGATLDTTLTALADLMEVQRQRAGELQSALIYPAFLLISAGGSVAVLLGYVVPTFEPLLADAGVALPWTTRMVIGAGRAVSGGWPYALGGIAALVIAARLVLARPGVRLVWHRLLLGLPLIGGLWRRFDTARLARTLGALLANGLALPQALRLAMAALGNRHLAAEIARVTAEVEAGRGLAGPLGQGGAFPPLAVQLIAVGEETAKLDQMLLKLAQIFEAEAKQTFDQLLAVLTPALTLVMGALIALIISSILFALFSINQLAL